MQRFFNFYAYKYNILVAVLLLLVVTGNHLLFAMDSTTKKFDGSVHTSKGVTDVFEDSEEMKKPVFVDLNDYYYLSNGEVAAFRRSKSTYMLYQEQSYPSQLGLSAAIKSQFAGQLEIVDKHAFGDQILIKVRDYQNMQEIISRIYMNYPTITFISPLLRSKESGFLAAVLPQIVVRISADFDPQEAINLLQLYNLNLVSNLIFTKSEFKFEITKTITDVGEIFEITRDIASLPYVDWAEPNFVTQAEKTFTPNDPLYDDQWHLNNTGQNNAVVDADVDAPEGWEISKGAGTVIAVIDDGVQINHPDIGIWSNPGESGVGKEDNGIDDDGNGFIDDFQGWDFNNDDNDPNPEDSDDNHGTAVAGIAGAVGNNGIGVSGIAMEAQILPVRIDVESATCEEFANAMRYAGKYADVVNCSWKEEVCKNQLASAIYDVVNGEISGARRGFRGTPVVFSSGNGGSGWRRYRVTGIPAGTYEFRWKFEKDALDSEGYDTVWLDNISWPGGVTENFENQPIGTTPTGFTNEGDAIWSVVSDGIHARGANGKSVKAGEITNSQKVSLIANQSVGSGNLTFWVWVSCEAPSIIGSSEFFNDFFEFSIDGRVFFTYAPGQDGVHTNDVSYPASDPNTIAVGATNDGFLSGVEERTSFSQFGPQIDVVASGNGEEQGITTTDRTGSDGYTAGDYYSFFVGTSAAAPLVAGIVADMIALRPNLTTAQIRRKLQDGADKIGPYDYTNDRNDFYGHGRVNLYKTLKLLEINSAAVMAPLNLLLLLEP